MSSRHCTLACVKCGRAAAEITLLPGTLEGEGLWHKDNRLERTDFLGEVVKFGDDTTLTDLFELLARGDYAAASALDPDFSAFICRECGRPYCEKCWRLDPPEFDEGFYDCTHGTCPAGHTQLVDD